MSRKYKCYGTCGEKYENDLMVIHSNKRYCKSCYEQKIRDEEDRKTLYNLIRKSYNVTFPTSIETLTGYFFSFSILDAEIKLILSKQS